MSTGMPAVLECYSLLLTDTTGKKVNKGVPRQFWVHLDLTNFTVSFFYLVCMNKTDLYKSDGIKVPKYACETHSPDLFCPNRAQVLHCFGG